MELTGVGFNGKNGAKGVVRCVGFYNDWLVGNPMGKNGSGSECGFESFKGFLGGIGKVPRSTLAGQTSERSV